jgi:hypothetical protein
MKFVITLLYLIITFSFLHSYGQDSTRVEFSISTNTTQYFFLDFPLIFEKYYTRHTLGLLISYRPSTMNSGEVTSGKGPITGEYVFQNYHNYLYHAVTVGVNSKYFFSKKNNLYIDGQVFYRYWWFDNKEAVFENVEGGYTFDGLRTEKQNILGFKLLFGKSIQIVSRHKIRPIINMYVGTGLRYKKYRFETFNGFVNGNYYTYKEDVWSQWIPSLEFGMNIGLGVDMKR